MEEGYFKHSCSHNILEEDSIFFGFMLFVLFVHELGHFLAMRYFGYTDTNIFFLPFGAATIGKKAKRSAYEEYIVSLMGPLPGIVIGIILFVSIAQYHTEFWGDGLLNRYAVMSIVINYINLLPVYPLDGGRILQTLLLSQYPRGRFYFYLIGLCVLTAATIWMGDPLLFIFVVLVALGLRQSYKISELLGLLFKKHHKNEIREEDIALVLAEDEKFSKESLASKARIAKQAQLLIHTKKPSKTLMVLGLALYIVLLAPPLVVDTFGLTMPDNASYGNAVEKEKKDLYAV